MSDVATLIADMVRAGVDPDLIGRAAAALSEREPVKIVDEQAERRRAKDRERKRLRNSAESADSVEGSHKKEIPPKPPKEKTTPPSSEANASSRCERDFFEEFWHAYPRREGPNPKKPARDRFLRLAAKGVDPETLIEAARRLAEEHPTPTRFVPQAITWLNQERWDNNDYSPRGDEFCPDDWENTRFLIIRFREERKTDPPRSIQGGKAGYLIPAEWVALSRSNGRAANA